MPSKTPEPNITVKRSDHPVCTYCNAVMVRSYVQVPDDDNPGETYFMHCWRCDCPNKSTEQVHQEYRESFGEEAYQELVGAQDASDQE